MDFARSTGPSERLLDLAVASAAACAGGACGFMLAAGPLMAALWGAIAGSAAALLMHWTGRQPTVGFAPQWDADWPTFEELRDEALLLDDALPEAAADSRVVRLFAPDTIAVPGELAQKIERWLDGARERTAGQAQAGGGGHSADASAASAAFHTALADLRRSLR